MIQFVIKFDDGTEVTLGASDSQKLQRLLETQMEPRILKLDAIGTTGCKATTETAVPPAIEGEP